MFKDREYKFDIDVFTPETLPMARLAEYMADLARLLGEPDSVHFVRLEPGSAVLVHRVNAHAAPKVSERLRAVRSGGGPRDARKAFDDLDERLRKDNGSAVLIGEDEDSVVTFPGRKMRADLPIGPVYQDGSLDGHVMRVGGIQDEVPVLLVDGPATAHWCETTREVARRLGQHLFGPEIRAYGHGRWVRTVDGRWHPIWFKIREFEILDAAPLAEVVAGMREIGAGDWEGFADPIAELRRLRDAEDSDGPV